MSSANTEPRFIKTPKVWGGILSDTHTVGASANTASDGNTLEVALIGTGLTDFGARIDQVRVTPIDTTVASVIRVYVKKASGVYLLIRGVGIAAYTASGTVAASTLTLQGTNGLPFAILEPGDSLRVTAGTALGPPTANYAAVEAIGGTF